MLITLAACYLLVSVVDLDPVGAHVLTDCNCQISDEVRGQGEAKTLSKQLIILILLTTVAVNLAVEEVD